MRSLILKDFLLLKKTILISILYVILMSIGFPNAGTQLLTICMVGITYMLVTTACATDDKNKADIILNSLPLSRKNIVTARYISVYLFAAIGLVVYIAVQLLAGIIPIPFRLAPVSLQMMAGAFFAVTLMNALYIPVFFKLGYMKSRIFNFILFFAIFFSIVPLMELIKSNMDRDWVRKAADFLIQMSDAQAFGFITLITAAVIFVSYMISLHFYRSREF